MAVVVLGAGAVGVATAWYLSKAGHDVTVVERQEAAALETSWGNGGVIHASESNPGRSRNAVKIVKWLGKENAPLLLSLRPIPHMWRGASRLRGTAPTKIRGEFPGQSRAGALFAAIAPGDRRELNFIRPAHEWRAQDLSVEGIARWLARACECCEARLKFERMTCACIDIERHCQIRPELWPVHSISSATRSATQQVYARLGGRLRSACVKFHYSRQFKTSKFLTAGHGRVPSAGRLPRRGRRGARSFTAPLLASSASRADLSGQGISITFRAARNSAPDTLSHDSNSSVWFRSAMHAHLGSRR